jgi:hypothetical protein
MMLRADQPAEPFGQMFVMVEQRSAIFADFPKAELLGLQAWAMSLHYSELRAGAWTYFGFRHVRSRQPGGPWRPISRLR